MRNIIINAIKNRQLLEFSYNGHLRIAEPHTFGVFSNGNEILVTYQVDGTSDSGKVPDWRPFTFSKIQNLQILNNTFSGARNGYKKGDSRFQTIYQDL